MKPMRAQTCLNAVVNATANPPQPRCLPSVPVRAVHEFRVGDAAAEQLNQDGGIAGPDEARAARHEDLIGVMTKPIFIPCMPTLVPLRLT
jgi:hypothetical protein